MKTVIAVTLTTTPGTHPDMLEYTVREALGLYIDDALPGSDVDKARVNVDLISALAFAQMAYSEGTGGNCQADVFQLSQGKVLVIADEVVAVYPTLKDWNEDQGDSRPSIPLY